MAADPQPEEVFDGETIAAPSRALVVPTVQLSSVVFTPLLTVLAAQLSGRPSEGASDYSTATQSYRAAAARVPQTNDADFEDGVFEEE